MGSRFQPPPPALWDGPVATSRRSDDPFGPLFGDEDDDLDNLTPREQPLSREEIDHLIERVLEEELERLRESETPAN